MGLQIDNPTDRDRPKVFQIKPYFTLEKGVRIIPENERHQVDPRLPESAMAESRQLLSESSATYVQDIDSGTNREQTLGEAQIKLQNANTIVGTMMDTLYKLETFREEEEFRRLLLPNTNDPDAKAFQARWKAHGIPEELMKPECWEVSVERVAGGGDKTLALQQVMLQMQHLSLYDPTAQRTIIREFTAVVRDDWDKAKLLVPEEKQEVTEGAIAADSSFGSLMAGGPVGLREGIEQRDYVETMMVKLDAVIQRIEQTDKMGTTQDIVGLNLVAEDIGRHLELMAQNPENKQFVTAVGKQLGKQMNLVKAYAQRQQEKQAEGQPDPEAMAKAQATQMAAQQKLEINQANFEQKFQQKEAQFEQKMNQDQRQFALEMKQALDSATTEIATMQAKALAEIKAFQAKTEQEIAAMKERAEAAPTENASSKTD